MTKCEECTWYNKEPYIYTDCNRCERYAKNEFEHTDSVDPMSSDCFNPECFKCSCMPERDLE